MKGPTALVLVPLLCIHAALAQTLPTHPDDNLTPGVVASTDPAEVCAVVDRMSYSRRHRVWHDKAGTLAKYGLPSSATRLVEDDDRVPVSRHRRCSSSRSKCRRRWLSAAT